MRGLFALALIWFSATAVWAELPDLPRLFNVAGVASDDTLNVRIAPDAAAEIIGELPHNASGQEVVALNEDQSWGQINIDGRAGWVSMRFMTDAGAPFWWELLSPMNCHGTEPFWNASLELGATNGTFPGQLNFSGLDLEPISLPVDWHPGVWGRPDWDKPISAALSFSGASGRGLAVIRNESCNDGMADSEYALSIQLMLLHNTDQARVQSSFGGCCSLSLR